MTLHAPGMRKFLASMVDVEGCWPWPKYCNEDGYGLTKLNGKTTVATRVAYQIEVGPIPAGMNVCHHCDNRPCVRPGHLFLGTQKMNCEDAKAKDRHCRGERNGVSKLTEADVRFIRANADTLSQMDMARKFAVRQSSIWSIINRKGWAHVQD